MSIIKCQYCPIKLSRHALNYQGYTIIACNSSESTKMYEVKEEHGKEAYLPALIHVIWAGGVREVPNEGMVNLARWAYSNPNFKIVLWVDDKVVTQDTHLVNLQELYTERFAEEYLKLAEGEESIQEINSRIEVRSIREHGICNKENDVVDYAIDRLEPNYGLSSDILRYRILYQYGGVYVDITDVTPGDQEKLNFLNSIPYAKFLIVNEEHKLYINHLSQTQNPSELELTSFNLSTHDFSSHQEEENEKFLASSKIGNDSFICTKGNPLMLLMVQETERRLQCKTFNERVMMAYGGFNIKDITLDLSGPNMVKTVIYNSQTGRLLQNKKLTTVGYYKKMSDNSGSYIFSLQSNQYQAVKPPDNVRNTRYWNDVPLDLIRIKTVEDVISQIVKLATYEITKMGVLRLDDHISILTQALTLFRIPPQELPDVYEKFLLAIEQLPLDQVKVAQCISDNPYVLRFYEKNELNSKILLNTTDNNQLSNLLKVWEQCTSFGLFMGTQDFQVEHLRGLQTQRIKETLSPIEICDIFRRIERGVKFITLIQQNKDSYPCYKSLIMNNVNFQNVYFSQVVNKYCIVLDVYSDAFHDSGVNLKNLCQVGRVLLKLTDVDMLPAKLQNIIKLHNAKNINHALRIAASKDDLGHVRYLVKYADIDEQGGQSKRTALHQAAANGHEKVMELLIECGANPSIEDKDKKTADELYHTSGAHKKK